MNTLNNIKASSDNIKHSPGYKVIRDICTEFPVVPIAFRKEMLNGSKSHAAYRKSTSEIPALWSIESQPPINPTILESSVKVAFWNLERCKYAAASAEHLAIVDADVNLLCEMDIGMARSFQYHTTRKLVETLRGGYVYGVEFVELSLGDERERAQFADKENSIGLHGNTILSRVNVNNTILFRFEEDGYWYFEETKERRLGGRIAITTTIPISGVDVVFVCAHFESRGDPVTRSVEMQNLLTAVEVYAKNNPVIVCGDFNTNTTSHDKIIDVDERAALLAENPQRFIDPVAYEPMFTIAAKAGFKWNTANSSGTTQRPHTEPRYERKLDWFFTRGLNAWGANIVSAVDANGRVLSDHDLITVMISPLDL